MVHASVNIFTSDGLSAGRARIAGLQPVQAAVQIGRTSAMRSTSKRRRMRQQIAVRHIQQLEQEMLDLDVVVSPGNAQARGGFQRSCG